jgi:hypothetical protein
MLFHADRNVKENMFQSLKREAEFNISKKNEDKMMKRNEDRMRIESIMQKEREDQERLRMEKIKHMNDVKSEYHNLMNKKNEERGIRKNKFEDVKINTYGVNFNNNNQNINFPQNAQSDFNADNFLNNQDNYNKSKIFRKIQ